MGLLYYLYGPGRANEHTDAHLVGAWALGVRDPARDPGVTMAYLAALLDAPVLALPESRRPEQHVYHVSVRVAPEDAEKARAQGGGVLTDEQWAQVAREMLDASGMAPFGDPMGCRWVAVRHADDHVHIVATKIRQDGKRPEIVVGGQRTPATYMDGRRMQARARELERRYGLRLLADGQRTTSPALTRGELEKARRAGREVPVRRDLGRLVRRAAAASTTEADFFDAVRDAGIRLKVRTGTAGGTTGYAVALPGDRNGDGVPVWYSGYRLAPDLSLPRIRERWTTPVPGADAPVTTPAVERDRDELWRAAAGHVHAAAAGLGRAGEAAAAGEMLALADLLTVLGVDTPELVRDQIREAATVFERAGRAPGRRATDSPAQREIRVAITLVIRAGRCVGEGDEAGLLQLLVAVLLMVAVATYWYRARSHGVHQEAAALAGWHLRAATELTRGAGTGRRSRPVPARASAGPDPDPTVLADGERLLRRLLPEQADRILAEPGWPRLAATLATVRRAGPDGENMLTEAIARRDLADARSASEVLIWRLTRVLQHAAAEDIPATSPVPGGIPRPRTGPNVPGAVRCGDDGAAPLLRDVVRATVPAHAADVLADPAAVALARRLGDVRTAGQDPVRVLAAVAAGRGLDDAVSVAQVLAWRVQGWLGRRPAVMGGARPPVRGKAAAVTDRPRPVDGLRIDDADGSEESLGPGDGHGHGPGR